MEEGEREEEELLWSWGAGSEGQLGRGRVEDEHLPQLVFLPLPHLSISQISCGGAHTIALTSGGRVLTWGRGTCGQLGLGDLENSLQPKPVKFLESFVISHVSAGWNHSGFVSASGRLFTCGDGSFGQLGHGDYQSHWSPVEVSFFVSKHVGQIACGMRHSLVLLKDPSGDSIYAFGSGKRGQLGISIDRVKRSFPLPEVITVFNNGDIVTIYASGDHSAALSANKQLYTWGRGFSGFSDYYHPQLLPSPEKFSQVALGWNHALLLTDDGGVFMLGGNHHGMLSSPVRGSLDRQEPDHCPPCTSSYEVCRPNFLKVAGLDGIKVVSIAAGAEHSALVTENGLIMTWGWGEHGQLGLGNTCDRTTPQIVSLGNTSSNAHTRLKVYCGSGFTFSVKSVCKS
ncbi:regulator of chromosome condensation (RCC1) family protein [Tasmannia lanceolata]|uniref:regulator of chromosome condensation (RCC1) family protein n=1 Tax=Tasmannia lanceolata TaxID=3420 RepID=UPI004062BE94